MKHIKKNILLVSSIGFISLVLGAVSLYSFENNTEMQNANAYSPEASCPTTIDLNNSSVSEIRSYYSSLNNLSSSERQGTNLLKHLKTILKDGQIYWDYDNGSTIWQMYEITDRDWDKSPATAISGYNPSTNKIVGYSYGTSNNNPGSNPYLHALYINRDVDNQTKAWGDHTQTNWGINREHIWAKSHGFGADGTMTNYGGARGDPMHLWAGNGKVNNGHSNDYFGFVDTSKSYTDYGNSLSYCSGNLSGTSLNKGGGTVFEPQDSDKGDIARAVFYMAARYNNFDGDTDINANNPNLRLVDLSSDSNGTTKYDSTTTKTGNMGILRDLLAWNRLDPPDEWEIHRNNILYKNFTNNRNPFIDFPEWAEYIWGKSTLAADQRTITSFNNNSTGSANPSSDSINTFSGSSAVVPVTSVEVFPTSLSINVGDSNQLSATVLPDNATNKSVNWSSSNSAIVSIQSNGIFTAHAAGTATIKATANNGIYGTCTITVNGQSGTVTQYQLVTDGLKAGDKVVIGAQTSWSATTVHTLTKTIISSYYISPEDGTVSDGVLNVTSSMPVWTVGGTTGAFTFSNNNDYLYGKKSGSYTNVFPNGTSTTSNNTWSIALNSGHNGFDMVSPEGVYLQYTDSNYVEFRGYSSSNNNCPINFYRETEVSIYTAEEFAEDFLDSITCDATGNTLPVLSRNWSELSDLFDDVETSQKAVLVNSAADENGTIIEQAMARYDLLCRKYPSQFNNFINRSSANPNNSNLFTIPRIINERPMIIAFPIAGGIVIIGLVVFFTLKKKKVI